jgi:lincosamide and streptogramin A transport system ATP-binding/permease protein
MMKRSKVLEARQQGAIEEKSQLLKNIESADPLKITQLEYHTTRFVTLDNVSLFYGGHGGGKTVCQNISLTLDKGDRVALCGKNGTGKSSLIKLICGEGENLEYTGDFHRGTRLKISCVAQDTSHLRGSLSAFIRENGREESLCKAILRKLDFSRIQFDKDLADYSAGQKKKVLIAKSLCEPAHLLLWDEPLNYIDVISRMQIEQLILKYEPTILFVEHDAVFCDRIATKMIHL